MISGDTLVCTWLTTDLPRSDRVVLEANPEVADILNQMGGLIDNETMAGLNLRVDEGGEEPRPVAEDFLTEQGLLGGE